MALERKTLAIPLGGGVDEANGDKLFDPPAVRELHDAKWDKRGEYTKRAGAEALRPPTESVSPSEIISHDGRILVQRGEGGAQTYTNGLDTWETIPNATRPSLVRTDPVLVGNGSFKDPDVAYDPVSKLACVVYHAVPVPGEGVDRSYAVFLDAETRAIVHGPITLPPNHRKQPRVVSLQGKFLFLAAGFSLDRIVVASCDPSNNFDVTPFVTAFTGTFSAWDVHCSSPDEEFAHLAVAGDSGAAFGWKVYKLTSNGTVAASKEPAAGYIPRAGAISVLHRRDLSRVYVLYTDSLDPAGQMSLKLSYFSDQYDATTPAKTTILSYTYDGAIWDNWRLAMAQDGSDILCFKSYGNTASAPGPGNFGNTYKGFRYVKVTSSGDVIPNSQVDPALRLASRGVTTSSGTPIVCASVWDEFQGLVLTVGQNNRRTLNKVGTYGLDRLDGGSAVETTWRVSGIADVEGELWTTYIGLISSNEGDGRLTESFDALRSPDTGWRWGLYLARVDTSPSPSRAASAQGLTILSGGVVSAFDGQRLTELATRVVRNAWVTDSPQDMAGYRQVMIGTTVDPESDFVSPLPAVEFPSGAVIGGDNPSPPSVADWDMDRVVQYKVVFRWVDSAGNIRRSAPTDAITKRSWGTGREPNPTSIPLYDYWTDFWNFTGDPDIPADYDDPGNYVRWYGVDSGYLILKKPPPEALYGDPNTELLAELYRTERTYRLWDTTTGGSTATMTLLDTAEGNQSFRLCGVVPVGDIGGQPDFGWVRDPLWQSFTEIGAEAPVCYDEGGELPAEPCPPMTDVISTQRRLFGINGEDRLEVWYTKPFVAGYAPEWNAALTLRCAAEGGELVALAALDDKLVMFKERAIYVVPIFSGPDATGGGTAFQAPRQVSSDTGCINPNSVVSGPWGVMFQADRGIYRLGRDLSVAWVGEMAKDLLGDNSILSSTVVPEEMQVRFLLDNEKTLVFDYRVEQWCIWDSTPGSHAAVWRDAWCRLSNGKAQGLILKDAETYDDPVGTRPMLSVTTAWLKLASLQGYQRIRQALVLGDFYSGDLTVEVGYDYEDDWTQTEFYWEEDLEALDRFQLRVNLTRQKCQSIRFRISEKALTPYTKSLPPTLDSALAKLSDGRNLLPAPGAVTWSTGGAGTATPGQPDPAGGTDAWLLTDPSGTLDAAGVTTSSYVAGHAIFASVLIDKDASAPNFAEMRLNFPGGMGVGGRVSLRLDTGETSIAPGYTLTSVRVADLGAQWMVVLDHPGDPAASSANITIYPARGFSSSFPADNPAATGSVTVYGPRIADATVDPQGANPSLNIVDRPSVGRGFVLSGLQLEVGVKNGSFKMVTAMNRAGPDWLELTGVPKIDLSDTSLTALETPK